MCDHSAEPNLTRRHLTRQAGPSALAGFPGGGAAVGLQSPSLRSLLPCSPAAQSWTLPGTEEAAGPDATSGNPLDVAMGREAPIGGAGT